MKLRHGGKRKGAGRVALPECEQSRRVTFALKPKVLLALSEIQRVQGGTKVGIVSQAITQLAEGTR